MESEHKIMIRLRIRKVTYLSGRKAFIPEERTFLRWRPITHVVYGKWRAYHEPIHPLDTWKEAIAELIKRLDDYLDEKIDKSTAEEITHEQLVMLKEKL